MSGEACHYLLQWKKKRIKQGQNAFIVVFCPGFIRRGEKTMIMNIAFIVIFYENLLRTTKDENECNIPNHFLYKGTRVKNRQKKG
jgi:hypothetical protein